MNILTFIVAASTPNKTGGFVWKLVVNTPVQAFGITKTIKRTFYIGGMPVAGVIGTEVKEDIDRFEIVERGFELTEGENKGEIILLKWLHAKPY